MGPMYKYLALPFIVLSMNCNGHNNVENIMRENRAQEPKKSTNYEKDGDFSKDWLRGDFNNDKESNIKDVIAIVSYYSFNGEPPFYMEAMDLNLDKKIDQRDAILLLERLFNPNTYEDWVNRVQSNLFRLWIDH